MGEYMMGVRSCVCGEYGAAGVDCTGADDLGAIEGAHLRSGHYDDVDCRWLAYKAKQLTKQLPPRTHTQHTDTFSETQSVARHKRGQLSAKRCQLRATTASAIHLMASQFSLW